MTSKQLDFTEGSIFKKMLLFAWPAFLGNLLQSSYQFIDSLWVGNLLGANALAAVTVASPVVFTILSLMIGFNSASLTVLSQQKGKKDEEGLKESLNAFVFILGILTIILGVVGFFGSKQLLMWLDTPATILPQAVVYLQIQFLGIIFLFGYNFIGTVLRAMGDSRTPIRFITLAVLLNAVLDPLFIAVFDMGVRGAAIATVISQGVAFMYGLIYSFVKAGVPFTIPHVPGKRYAKAVLKLGFPGGLQMVAISSGLVAIISVVNSFGDVVVAGFGAGQRVENIIMLPAMTLGSVVTSMSGQNIGAGKWERVSVIARTGLLLIIVLSFSIGLLCFMFAKPLIGMFVNDTATIQYGASYLRIVAFFLPFLGINFVLNGVARSSGAMFQILILNIISFWVLRYPLTFLFSSWIGKDGIALGIGTSFVISSVIAGAYYRYGGWRKVRVFDQ